ncbi:MAG: hypothetical protein IPO63_15320 [Bacteroidetes bacterium]|nr:hypothetical protein [Bacteroidota bacterium]
MKKNSLFLVLFLLICVVKSNAQSTEKQYKQVLKDYTAHNYSNMLRHLDKLDDKYKSEAAYLQYQAIANDSLGEYEAAVKEYDAYLLLSMNDSSSAMRVLTLKQILVVRSRCVKCKGGGFVIHEKVCGQCQGRSVYNGPCKSCYGDKKSECPSCSGSGKIQGPNGQLGCNKCGGRGKVACNRCNQTGVMEEECRICKGGFIITKTKCAEHP